LRVALRPGWAPRRNGRITATKYEGRERRNAMAENIQQRIKESSGTKELVILVGVLFTVIAASIGTYWVRSKGVEAAPETSTVTGKPTVETTRPRTVVPAPPGGVFHADIYFDFKSTRLRADAARVLQETARTMDLSNAWVVLVQGYTDRQGPAEYNRTLAQRRAESVKLFLVELGVPESAIRVMTMGKDGALCDEPEKECQQINRRVHLEFRKLAAALTSPATAADTTTTAPAPTGTTSPAGDR
jgi:outer membrane protein OmpA-like peptidoglycan-associated protein